MELVTGAMGSLLPKRGELLKEEYGLQKDMREKIESLTRELKDVHAVLRKIAYAQPELLDEQLCLWVCDIREASYDMEDIVDTFLVRIDGPEPSDPNMLRRLRKKVVKLFKKSKARRKISYLIQNIYKKLDEIAARRGRYTVDNIPVKPAASTTIDPRIFNLYKRATELVGIDGPRDELIKMLSLGGDVDVPDKKKIISIVGFGGLGKTTLAKAVYEHVKMNFQHSAFVPVGRNPDMKKVLRDILIDLEKEKYMNSNMTVLDEKQLIDLLKEFIKENRCFIVIDDIWDKESWDLVKCAVQDSNCGSRVVVTTRICEVARYAGETYKIRPLSRENSEKLLCARILDGEWKHFDSPSADASDKILKKCGGVPLAIITIASLLANKPGEDWSEIYNCIGFGHGDNNVVKNTRKILSFSYYDLPSHLKACLLYLSMFPEDKRIDKNRLIWMWIAEGFIHEDEEGIGLFELGERCFSELINRSMIQPVETDCYVDSCRVHDMVYDMVRSLSSKEHFVTTVDGDEQHKPTGRIARRLGLRRIEEHNSGQLANITMDKVRSLIIAGQCNFGSLCQRVPVLRLLDFDKYCNQDLLDTLGSLHHLRYLRVAWKGITKLPREVRHLKFLQTLNLEGSDIEELPEEVGLLTQLVCLHDSYSYCKTRFPAGLIAKLTSLQELSMCPASEVTMQFVKELGMLKELRVLRTEFTLYMDVSMMSVLLESLGNLHNIQTLSIDGGRWVVMPAHAERPISCRHLQYLYFKCISFSELPASIRPSLAQNLSYLSLVMKAVKEQDMETLASMPELRCLNLFLAGSNKALGIKIRTEAGYFWKLGNLRISGSAIWFDLRGCEYNNSVASTIMPSLESLDFLVDVQSLVKNAALHCFDGLMLGFEKLGRTSLCQVDVKVDCEGARLSEVEEVEAALQRTAAAHPKRPTLRTEREKESDMIPPYQEACMEVSGTPDFVIKTWKLEDIVDSGHIRALRIPPDPAASPSKVIRLLYENNGKKLWALNSNAVLKRWEWGRDKNPHGSMVTTSVPRQLWQPPDGMLMTNDTTNGNPEEAVACIAISKDNRYIISASGGEVSMFDMVFGEKKTGLPPPPPAATAVLAFCLHVWDIFVIGMEDSSIHLYHVRKDKVIEVLMGHQKKITGLTFSESMKVLVSSDADAQLCVWRIEHLILNQSSEMVKSSYMQSPSDPSGVLVGDTRVQFHYDQKRLLVVHESQLATYDGKQLECLHSWSPRDALPSQVSSAVYSSDGLMIYAGFRDGAIGIFEAESLSLQCRIAPSAYIPSSIPSGGIVYPMDVAANPWRPNQFAVAMSDGAVHVLEPMEN